MLLRAPMSPQSLRASGDIITTVDVNRAIKANKRMTRRNHRSVSTSVPHKIIKQALKPTSHHRDWRSHAAIEIARTATISSNDTIERRWPSMRPEQNTSLAIKKMWPTKGVTYEETRHWDGARCRMQQIWGCWEAGKQGKRLVSTSEGATPRQGGWVNKEHNLFIVERDYGLEEATRSFGRMYFILTGVETFLLYHCKDDASRARVC
jgi:hypothetical protein